MPPPQIPQRLYQSPPGSGGNDGALPTVYDPTWQTFTNLTVEQVVAFESFPPDLRIYSGVRRWLAEITTLAVTVTILGTPTVLQIDTSDRGQARVDKLVRKWGANATATTAFKDSTGAYFALNAAALIAIDNAVTNYIESLHTAESSLITGINAATPTITTRKQIDAAYAAIAPNSPSGLQPSPT